MVGVWVGRGAKKSIYIDMHYGSLILLFLIMGLDFTSLSTVSLWLYVCWPCEFVTVKNIVARLIIGKNMVMAKG
ncbi:Uncharacterized protein TCM_004845 [Theobroma cacao]|uniref:Uncharacterized protein n=1 Tax=Theobroma cacao TaxID=3641 RepID=A0A061DZ68_THECC|nr:Uncharacterized protein TCM_004845 [Theobroma cacao]